MVPICIVTRNRHHLLDITLRSLSASDLPPNQVLVVFDDASDDPNTQRYLYTDEQVSVYTQVPASTGWSAMGLDDVKPRRVAQGLKGRVLAVPLGVTPQGVVNASCRAFSLMVEMFGPEHGIIMCQDDVVFNADWFTRIYDAQNYPNPESSRPIGLITGCWLNREDMVKRIPMSLVPEKGITAQCYYVTPAGVAAIRDWAAHAHNLDKGFDNKFCAYMREGGADVYRMYPAVCQHIGFTSSVRPKWKWYRWSQKGRVDYSTEGPFPLTDDVRKFESEVGDVESSGSGDAADWHNFLM